MIDSYQKWCFDWVRDLVNPTPAQIVNDDLGRVLDRDLGHNW
jgi:hypothetical protein